MVVLEKKGVLKLCGIDRGKDFQYFIENKRDISGDHGVQR